VLTTSKAAELIGVSVTTVRRYADAGTIPCRRLPPGRDGRPGHRRFREQDVRGLARQLDSAPAERP
jgi:excisionase family DNA binding protein